MPTLFAERRRVQRVKLIEPLRGAVGAVRVFVIDLAIIGVRIAHQETLGISGTDVVLETEWEGRPIRLECRIERTKVHRMADKATAKTLYHSGLTIRGADDLSLGALRDLIHVHVVRALDEQKANARGIPATAPQSTQTGQATHYTRHEMIGSRWRETDTTDPSQPPNGFTVSASHTPQEVSMLRSAFENADRASGGHELIRRLAKMSIAPAEGVPSRRFMP
jgi:hypothetical protein